MATSKKQKDEKLPEGFFRNGRNIWFRTDPITKDKSSSGCRTVEAAKAEYARREASSRAPVHSSAQSFGAWVKKTLDWKKSTRSEGTVDMYNIKLGHALRLFGAKRPISEFDAEFVDQYIAKRTKEGVKNNTIARELTAIRQVLRLAYRGKAFPLDPKQVMPIGFSQNYVPVSRTLTLEELPKLLDVLSESERAWVCYALATGGDIGDVERAQPEDYDATSGTVRVRGTKTKTRDAIIPVPEMFRDLIEYAVPRMPLSWPSVSKRLPERCKKAVVSYVTPKDLRRTAATWLAEAGVSLDLLARWLRHSGLALAHQVYNKTRPTALRDLIEAQIGSGTKETAPWRNGRRGGFKSQSEQSGGVKTPKKTALTAKNRPQKTGDFEAELAQCARERIARLSLQAAVVPELRPSLKLVKCVPEAYLLAKGDTEALAIIEGTLEDLAREFESEKGAA